MGYFPGMAEIILNWGKLTSERHRPHYLLGGLESKSPQTPGSVVLVTKHENTLYTFYYINFNRYGTFFLNLRKKNKHSVIPV